MTKMKTRPMRMILTSLLTATALLSVPTLAAAQSIPHGIAAVVNSDIVTTHDLRQRVMFMLATTGVERDEASLQRVQRQALQNLVDEHLQMQEAPIGYHGRNLFAGGAPVKDQ